MRGPATSTEDYLQAFMSGFEFVLLAIQGRLEEGTLPEEERARVEAFLADYWRIARAYHDRHDAPAADALRVAGPLPVEVSAAMAN